MVYESELRFLCDTLAKCHIPSATLRPDDPIDRIFDDNFHGIFGTGTARQILSPDFLQNIRPYTIYMLDSPLHLSYIFLQLPNGEILTVGPYTTKPFDQRRLLEIGERNNISPAKQKQFNLYYEGIPIIPENSHIFLMIESFAEHIWGKNCTYTTVDLSHEIHTPETVLPKNTDNTADILIDMELMERRYAYENELIRAVSQGHEHKIAPILDNISSISFDKRLNDQLRNLKNYCIIMNTLLRKAAESGGAHPLYIHEMSSSFAAKIEQLSSVNVGNDLMREIFQSYCRLVRKHAIKQYGASVQKTIAIIDSDLSANLSLRTLAALQKLSPGYLSSVFKKETGKTITQYIADKRMHLAMYLLSTTRLQIQTVALHCGMLDIQYFSKVFKRYTGKTPKEYRESI